jgi:hypothetical protein
VRSCRFGRLGGDGAYTAIVLMHKMKNGQFVIERVVCGRWSALEREQVIKRCLETDYANMGRNRVSYQIEIELRSGGKESYETSARNLAGYSVIGQQATRRCAPNRSRLRSKVEIFSSTPAHGKRTSSRKPRVFRTVRISTKSTPLRWPSIT